MIASIFVAKLTHNGQLEMEIILNASLAGGVVIGASADIIVIPCGAMIAGFIAGVVSSLGFAYLSKFLQRTIKLHDTCGVLNLHGMPGFMGGCISAIVASRADTDFGDHFSDVYLAGDRTAKQQAAF